MTPTQILNIQKMKMNNGRRVVIMMATYNGEKYIRKQLDSILQQTYKNWELVIRDDLSNDNTAAILNEYLVIDKRISLLKSEKRQGWIGNYHLLVNECKNRAAGYYTFSDQDDIWSKNRLSEFVKYFDGEGKQKVPTLLFSDVELIDSEDICQGRNTDNYALKDIKNQMSYFFQDGVIGCNIFMNRKLFDIAPKVDISPGRGAPAHDAYFCRIAAFTGKIKYIDKKLLFYRRHSGNASDHQFIRKPVYFLKRLLALDKLAEAQSWAYKNSLRTIDYLKQIPMKDHRKKKLDELEAIIRHGGLKALWYVAKNNISLGGNDVRRDIGRKIVLVTGGFKKYL